MKTVAEAWGEEAANDLAMWAIDALMEPPTEIATFATRMPAHVIRRGREILDRAGYDWRAHKRARDGDAAAHNARRKS